MFKKYKVKFSISGCNNLLHRLGFSFKKQKAYLVKQRKRPRRIYRKIQFSQRKRKDLLWRCNSSTS
ncbi:MAG: hypothetical protein HOP07_06570 [Bacteriovoracaceae bacterium]|nr:hypothetical protein [Bacteriovoracaceae bacterium]